MTIKLTQHIDLLPVYVCPTCLKPTPFQAGEHWQVCEEHHFAEVRAVTFANGEARQVMVPVEKPVIKWPEQDTSFGLVRELDHRNGGRFWFTLFARRDRSNCRRS
jgi:hypothetical protein